MQMLHFIWRESVKQEDRYSKETKWLLFSSGEAFEAIAVVLVPAVVVFSVVLVDSVAAVVVVADDDDVVVVVVVVSPERMK